MLRQWMIYLCMLVMNVSLFAASEEANLNASRDAATKWFNLIDSKKYDESWKEAAPGMRDVVTDSEWQSILKVSRDPLGNVQDRKLIDHRVAENPKWLPNGDYVIMFYRSNFDKKSEVKELLTMTKANDGVWRVLTYQVQ